VAAALSVHVVVSMRRRPPRLSLFPYTTLFRSDRVRIVVTSQEAGERRAEGRVIRVLERANHQVIGYYQKNKNFGFVVPDNPRISDRKSTRLNSSHVSISYAVFCLKKKND